MSVYSSAVAVALAGCLLSHAAAAQATWSPFLGFGSGPSSGAAASTPASSLLIQPGAYMESPRGSMLARWSSTVDQPTPQLGDADFGLRTRLSTVGPLESSLVAATHYDRGSLDASAPISASSTASLRLQLGSAAPSYGMQLGLGLDAWRSAADQGVAPASTVSGWIRRFGLSFSAEISAHAIPGAGGSATGDTANFRQSDSTAAQRSLRLFRSSKFDSDTAIVAPPFAPPAPSAPTSADAASAAHTFGEAKLHVSGILLSLGLEAEGGLTMATRGETRSFGSLILTHWLTPGIAVTGGFVLQPPEPGSTIRRSGGLLGIRLAGAPQLIPHITNAPKAGVLSTTVRVAGENTILEVHAPGSAHVEVSGDFTHWQPVALERGVGDRWTLLTKMTPGLHRLVVRVDGGEWRPPPGLPQAVDLYEGNVGVIVAP